MKGKTGKPAMRGGGLARKGVGAALKGGGIARKGTGSNATPGGKVSKMAMGGSPMPTGARPAIGTGTVSGNTESRPGVTPMPGRMPAFPGRPGEVKKVGPGEMGRGGGFGGNLGGGPTLRPSASDFGGNMYASTIKNPIMGGGMTATTMPVNPLITQRQTLTGSNPPPAGLSALGGTAMEPRVVPMAMKKGGKVAKYAKGGAVKMTAGAGSGSGRLEKVAAHKAAPRVKAVGLKKGGKVKGK